MKIGAYQFAVTGNVQDMTLDLGERGRKEISDMLVGSINYR